MNIHYPLIIDLLQNKLGIPFKREKPHGIKTLFSETPTKLIEKVNKIFWVGLGCWATYNLLDMGISNFLALETLRHGTGPMGYVGINLFGADPAMGGSIIGSSVGSGCEHFARRSKNYFHVFKDSQFLSNLFDAEDKINSVIFVLKPLLPRMHAVESGMATFNFFDQKGLTAIPTNLIGGIAGFLTPTLKFRFTPKEVMLCDDLLSFTQYEECKKVTYFENDPDYDGIAYRTTRVINASRLGIVGSLLHGLNSTMFSRMMSNPQKVVVGAALIGVAAFVARKTYLYYMKSSAQDKWQFPLRIFNQKPNIQSKKQKVKKIAEVALAVTGIFLNTL